MKVVTKLGVFEKAKASVRFFKDDVSATIMFKTYEKPLMPTS